MLNTNIILSTLKKKDLNQMKIFLKTVIADAFEQDKIDDPKAETEEIQKQLKRMTQSIETNGKSAVFIVAKMKDGGKIVGTIACSAPNELIKKTLNADLANVPEITSVLVLPSHQGKGIGSFLLKETLKSLKEENIHEFCLDGGYKKSQKFWTKKLGPPDITIKNHYGKGRPYMIWHRNIDDLHLPLTNTAS